MSKFSNLGPDEEAALRYDALSNSLGLLGMAVYVAEGERFIQVSEAFERFTGYDAAHPDLIPPDSRLVAPADLEKLS